MKGDIETESVETAMLRFQEVPKEKRIGSKSHVPSTIWNWFKWETELIHLYKRTLILNKCLTMHPI